MLKNIRHIALLFVLSIGVLGNVFAGATVNDGSKISVEKSAVGAESIKAWEKAILRPTPLPHDCIVWFRKSQTNDMNKK